MRVWSGILLILLIVASGQACRKAYLPPITGAENRFLVVEGTINTGADSTFIKLSRTIKVSSQNTAAPELHATVTIESDGGSVYQLAEAGSGRYAAAGLNLGGDHKYRLKISTSDSKTYQSDFVEALNAPPIDSVNYVIKNDGLRINVNAHDPSNKVQYYRWSYAETYKIHAVYSSVVELFHVPKDTIMNRPLNDRVYSCWRFDTSSTINVASTAKLTHSVITQNELTNIASSSEKIGDRYSILVTQYALTADGFNYWQQLKKNTEQLGSIFDAQPSALTGNIHCVSNPSEPVIGFISVGATTQMRIYIDTHQLPAWAAAPYTTGCSLPPQPFLYVNKAGTNEVAAFLYPGFAFPVGVIQPPGSPILGFTATDRICADCTLRGTNKQPAFWTDY